MIYWKDVSRCNIGIAPFCYYPWSFVLVLVSGGMKKTTIICNDWQDMYLDHMTDEEAGKLFKIMLSLRNGRDVEIPADFKFIMTHVQKFWDDQDVSYQKSVEW